MDLDLPAEHRLLRDTIRAFMLDERGLISRVWSVMHFAPPLTVTKDEIDRMVTIADEVLTIAEGEFASDIS